jgi:signal transduction histidine kinase/ActR/RegA family two-component response regulator
VRDGRWPSTIEVEAMLLGSPDQDADLSSMPPDELVARARVLETVLKVVLDVTSARSLSEVAERFAEAVAAYTRFPSLAVWRYVPSCHGFEVLALRGFDESRLPPRKIMPAEGSLTGLAARRRAMQTTDDIANDERVDPEMRVALPAAEYMSGACIPVIHGGEVIGSFNLIYPRGTALGANERDLLETLATSLGLAMAQHMSAEHERELAAQARRAQQLESLGVLAGGIAHDFNNLLTGILGNVDLARTLIGDAPSAEIAELLETALAAGERAKKLVTQLLTFSHGGAPTLGATIDLAGLIREVSAFAARGSGVRLAFEIEEPLGVVEVDLGQIGQVVQNLVLNACQASPRGATVTVRARRAHDSGGEWIVVEIVDAGHGIEPQDLPRLFEPFFTVRPGGTGLGLAMSQSIVRRHGGRLSVRSTPGEGSTFTVELPAGHREVAGAAHAEARGPRFSGRALVLDDDDAVRSIAERLLGRLGFEVQGARDGLEALALARHAAAEFHPFRVAVLDLTIAGGLGGADIADDLRRESPGIRLVASSGYAPEDEGEDEAERWDAVLPKPYQSGDIAEAIERALRSATH